MDLLTEILSYVLTIITGLFAFVLKNLHDKVSDKVTEAEVRAIIDDKLEVVKQSTAQLDARLERLEDKIDRLLEMHQHKK